MPATGPHPLDWKTRTVLRILLIVAGALSEGKLQEEVRGLSNHINAALDR